jgi:hypothetical protein
MIARHDIMGGRDRDHLPPDATNDNIGDQGDDSLPPKVAATKTVAAAAPITQTRIRM